MKRICAALATVCAAAFAAPAMAEGWVVMDLGEVKTREACMERADRVIRGYVDFFGGHSVEEDSWTKYGYDLEPGDNDVLIMCPMVNGGVYNAFLAVYGAFVESEEDHTDQVAEQLQRLWNRETDQEGEGGSASSSSDALSELDRALRALEEAQAAVTAAREALGASGGVEGDSSEDGEVIDLDELLAPYKQELRDSPPSGDKATPDEAPVEEAAPETTPESGPESGSESGPDSGEAAPAEEDQPTEDVEPDFEDEDISPVQPR